MQTSSAITLDASARVPILNKCDAALVRESLKQHGALLIRAGSTLEEFEKLSDELITPMVHHSTSTSVERDVVNVNGTTSTVNKGMDYIPLHREGSYAPGCPDLLMLYCVKPAEEGGETTLCDGVEVLHALPARIREFVEQAILRWRWSATPERWMTTLGVSSKEEASAVLAKINLRLAPYEKLESSFNGDTLDGVFQTLCVIPTKWSTRQSFCNSLLIYHYREATPFYPKSQYVPSLGDGSPFPTQVLEEIAACAEPRTRKVYWEENQILIFDNSRYMHGRTGFSDRSRRILVRMGHVRGESHDQNI
jgi:hypothetical protein